MIKIKCNGCGSILQDEHENEPGFVPELKEGVKYCKRCFRMMNYNELPKIVASNEDYIRVIDDVLKKNGLIVFVVDIFQFKATFNHEMIKRLRDKNVILVANKYDVFPHSVNIEKIVTWLSRECEKIFFRVDAIHIVSSKKGYFIEDLTRTIDLARRGRDVYFLGCANVGKSSLINALLKKNTSKTTDTISTSMIPGTTLNEITIPFFDDNKGLIDTPGLINPADICNQILPKSYKTIMPNAEMKPKTYQITDGNSICLAGLAAISFKSSEKVSAIVYTANSLYIHRCKTERVNELFETQLGKLLTPPDISEINNLKYREEKYSLDGKKKKDIWFSGFGFVEIIGKCDITVKTLENEEVYITDAII